MKKVIKWIFSDFKSHPMKTWMIASFSFLVIISYALADIVKRDPILEVYLILLFPILGLIYTVYISRKFFNHSGALSILSLTAYILAYFYILDFNKVTPQDGKTFLFSFLFLSGFGLLFLFDETPEERKKSGWWKLIKDEWFIPLAISMLILIPLGFYLYVLLK